jgi:hypothetical protein
MPNLTVVQAFTTEPFNFMRKNSLGIESSNKAQAGFARSS